MTKAADRARERRRAEKLAARRPDPVPVVRRDRQLAIALIGALIIVIGVVWFASRPTGSPVASPTALPTAQATGTASPTSSPSPTTVTLSGCTKAPPAPGKDMKITQAPDLKTTEGKQFIATITTNCGDIQILLEGNKAPKAVASFRLLAAKDYWRNTPCHRLTGNNDGLWILQCGDPTGTGSGAGPGYSFGIENAPADGLYPRGTVAMARVTGDPNSNTDQFFIVYKDTTLPTTDGGYTIFGTVIKGMDIVDKIAAAGSNPKDSSPLAPLSMLSVSVKAKG